MHSTTEDCAPVWCRSAHTCLIDPAINDALRTVTGCLRLTPADNLATHAGLQPAELRRNGATLSLGRRSMEPGHLLHPALTRPSGSNAQCLKSRHPFVPAAQQLICSSDNNNIGAAHWADHQWNEEVGRQPHKTPHLHPRHRHPSPEWLYQEEPGSGLTASTLVSDVSAPVVQVDAEERRRTNRRPCCPPKWRRRTNRRPCCPPMSNPSTSSWTARPDGFGRWDNRMAAQHLPRDLKRPSSG